MKKWFMIKLSPRWGRVLFALACLALTALFVSIRLETDQISRALDKASSLGALP